ncbi:MAG: response regulator [Gammaproteobacteria bacterium]|jgi:two-component system OmpR family response regulator|nr:response regulator [Gammaproteobacteria bacterium]
MERRDHILVVDDDAEIRRLLADYLDRNGYRATTVGDGPGMREALAREAIDLVILDLMLPGEDGLELCRKLRASSALPVIMLTARGEETDRIVGLEMGADDYLPKPFSPRELLARIKGVLRRTRQLPPDEVQADTASLRFAGWVLDLEARHLVSPRGVITPLGGAEYSLLSVLLTHPGRVLSRDQLLDLARGREAIPFDRSIDMLISRLRKRLQGSDDEQIIRTVRGQGYVLAVPVERDPA